MAFLEELGKTLTDKGKEAAKRAKELTGVLQLKSQLTGEKAKLSEVYARLGKVYYEEHQDDIEERFEDDFAAVKAGMTKILELEQEICQLEGNRVCAECGAKVDREARFCSRCGAPMEEHREPVVIEEPEEAAEPAAVLDEDIFEPEDDEDFPVKE